MFGPQKGADPATVALLEAAADRLGRRTRRGRGPAVSDEPGAGAAGGIGAALLALGGRRESGAAVIAEHTDLADDVAAAELIITGEGRFDDQSLHGKVVSALAAGPAHAAPRCWCSPARSPSTNRTLQAAGIAAAYSITDYAGSVQLAIDDAANQLTGLARRQRLADWPALARVGNSGRTRYR